jgi:ADP-heptose:LPS heptosyltransferase
MRKKLDRVTMVIVDTVNYGQAVNSLQKSLEQIEPARTLFFTDQYFEIGMPEVEMIQIKTLHSKNDYSHFIIKELWKYIETEFVLITQWDGFVLNGDSWKDEFLNYDYIGAPWTERDGWNVGNGGFSIRSQRLHAILGNDPQIQIWHPEDSTICRLYRAYLEVRHKIRFANDDLGDLFSFELRAPVCKTFGFHGHFHIPYKDTVVITRKGAAGDVIALEPLLHYYFKRGYKVVLNTTDYIFNYFRNHFFKVHHPKEVDPRIVFKEYNLDLAYEVFPKQLHLKSYYQMCGIPESEWDIRNPILTMNYDTRQYKLFNKLVVLHLDQREQASRNIEGVNWESVVAYLHKKGYAVIQIGIGVHDEVRNAVFMNTFNEWLLMGTIGSADLFIGIDSAPANIAVALGIKAMIFSGSVDLRYIIPDMSNVVWMHNHDKKVCDTPWCWHNSSGCTGTACYIDDEKPPCNKFTADEVIAKLKSIVE